MKEKLRSLITVNTFSGSDKFYFKSAPIVGSIDGKPARCVFFYSYYDEYMVYALAWEGDGFDFHYLNESDMRPSYEHHFRTLDKDSGQFVPASDIVDIYPNYNDIIYAATQEQENIEYNKYYGNLYDEERELQYYFQSQDKENGYDRYDKETYLKEYPLRLKLNEYHLLHERYVNLKPDVKGEADLEIKKSYTEAQILSEMKKDKKQSESMRRILEGLFKKDR